MAVKSIFPLSSTDELLNDSINFLNSQTYDLNLLHGHLLLVDEIIKKSDLNIISKIQNHCISWKWIGQVECDVIQALYFKLCHAIYFTTPDEKHFEERKDLWDLSKKGLQEHGSYGSLTCKAEIYLCGIAEFSSEADIDIVSLKLHPLYEVQMATFKFLNSSLMHEPLNVPGILDTCLLLLTSKNTKEEVLRCASQFLGRNCKNFHGKMSLGPDIIYFFEENILANRSIEVYLPSMGSIIALVNHYC